jgi:imidazolonepropionase
MRVDLVVDNCNLATMDGPSYGAIEDGLVAVRDGRIAWVGARADAPALQADDRIDGGGGWLTPALIDCHTHLVHGGNRAAEFEMRLQGASYEDIARAGGGILSTVRATREASEAQLL